MEGSKNQSNNSNIQTRGDVCRKTPHQHNLPDQKNKNLVCGKKNLNLSFSSYSDYIINITAVVGVSDSIIDFETKCANRFLRMLRLRLKSLHRPSSNPFCREGSMLHV
jgi:hypothetical protein